MASASSEMGFARERPDDPFPRTLWTEVVQVAGDPGAERSRREASWERLVGMYRRPIELCLRAKLRGHPAAVRSDELVDEFFSYLVQHAIVEKAKRGVGSFRGYIQGVIKNFAHSTKRADAKHGVVFDADAMDAGGIDDRLIVEEERAWANGLLREALVLLAKKNPRQAEAIRLRYGIAAGAPAQEESALALDAVAARLGSGKHAIEELLRRARAELKVILLRCVVESLDTSEPETYHLTFVGERDLVLRRAEEEWPGLLMEQR